MTKYTLSEMASIDIEMHRVWKEACAIHMAYRNAPKPARGYRRSNAHTAMGEGMKSAGENARYLHKAWANWRDLRIAAGGSVIKYPKYPKPLRG